MGMPKFDTGPQKSIAFLSVLRSFGIVPCYPVAPMLGVDMKPASDAETHLLLLVFYISPVVSGGLSLEMCRWVLFGGGFCFVSTVDLIGSGKSKRGNVRVEQT
jgi:hypothetical protein